MALRAWQDTAFWVVPLPTTAVQSVHMHFVEALVEKLKSRIGVICQAISLNHSNIIREQTFWFHATVLVQNKCVISADYVKAAI